MNLSNLRTLIIAILLCNGVGAFAQSANDPLEGEWTFGLDPVNVGVNQGWFESDFPLERWDRVTVPHSYSVDPRYHNYTGTAWYLKRFGKVALPEGYRAIIRFDAVFYKAQVWLNGQSVGEHEGGYTPFEIDITKALSDQNALALRVNNAWDTTTIPGAKTKVTYQSASMQQMYPWMNYGGITRPLKLMIRPGAYIGNTRIVATPDLKKKTANVEIHAFIRNKSAAILGKKDIQAVIYQGGKKVNAKFRSSGQDIAPGSDGWIQLDAALAAKDVKLWYLDDPTLYVCELIAGKDTVRTSFGIRKVEIQGTKLLLNGESISLGGCNRPLDYPGYGSMDPAVVLEKDLTLIKEAGMELSRISHYPVSTELLDWADCHGLLIIAEAGNWQMTPKQLADPAMRAKFQSQMREMVERDWNHPSVIAWSVGNEYQSQTEEGKAWTRDMYAFAKSLDPTRLVTFSTNIVARDIIKTAADEASQYVDFVSANIYGGHLRTLQRIHTLYPDKPVYVSEFGIRADEGQTEALRAAYLEKAMNDFRQCDFLIGASVWTFNDYKSAFPLSNANGYRPWGLVSIDREPRGMYLAWQEAFAPAVSVEKRGDGKADITVTSREDFPRHTLRGYKLSVAGQSFDIPLLKPGESKTFTVDVKGGTLELIKPGGFVVLKRESW